MKLENFPPRNRDAQTKEIGNLKNIQKERFKSKDKYILDDSEFIADIESLLFCISYILKEITISHQF